jgi:hypothetical protein
MHPRSVLVTRAANNTHPPPFVHASRETRGVRELVHRAPAQHSAGKGPVVPLEWPPMTEPAGSRILEKEYVAVKRCRHGNFNPNNFFSHPHRLFGEYLEANVRCFRREAKVNAVGLWPVERLDDTFVKAMERHRTR